MTDSDIALKAAKEAAKIISSFDQNRDKLNIDFKGKNDLITDADLASEKKILEVIQSHCPSDTILAEESTGRIKLTNERTWIIDPIDGTTNFAHGFPVYCVSIGLWENQQPKDAVVLEVHSGTVFQASKGKGATMNGKPISVSNINNPKNALLATGFPYNNMDLLDDYLSLFRDLLNSTQGMRRPGSAAFDLCLVAAGKCDGFYEYGLAPWDTGAGSLIIQEAGGVISDWDGGQDWLFGRRIICGNPTIHEFLLEKVKTFIPSEKRKAEF